MEVSENMKLLAKNIITYGKLEQFKEFCKKFRDKKISILLGFNNINIQDEINIDIPSNIEGPDNYSETNIDFPSNIEEHDIYSENLSCLCTRT